MSYAIERGLKEYEDAAMQELQADIAISQANEAKERALANRRRALIVLLPHLPQVVWQQLACEMPIDELEQLMSHVLCAMDTLKQEEQEEQEDEDEDEIVLGGRG